MDIDNATHNFPPPLLVLFLHPVLRDRPNGFLVSFMFARFALSDVLTELARCSRSSNENLLVNSWNSQRWTLMNCFVINTDTSRSNLATPTCSLYIYTCTRTRIFIYLQFVLSSETTNFFFPSRTFSSRVENTSGFRASRWLAFRTRF